jgi:hypothetical protein
MTWLVFTLAYALFVQAVLTRESAWVAADKDKSTWAVLMAIPGINVIVGICYLFVLPSLFRGWSRTRDCPFRRAGDSGVSQSSAPSMPRTSFASRDGTLTSTRQSTAFCIECGKPGQSADKYCGHCGADQKQLSMRPEGRAEYA